MIVLEAAPKLLARNRWTLRDLVEELSRAGYRHFAIGRFGLELSDLKTTESKNWLCPPEERMQLACRVQRVLRRVGLMPMIQGVNPLVRGGN